MCSTCNSTEVAWFIKDKPYCQECAFTRFIIEDKDGNEVTRE